MNGISIDAFKGIALGSTWLTAIVGGMLPFFISRCAKSSAAVGGSCADSLLSVLNAASGGVFLSAGLMHLLADAITNEELERMSVTFWGEENGAVNAIALCVAGFVLLILVEQLAQLCVEGDSEYGHGHAHDEPLVAGYPATRIPGDRIQSDEAGASKASTLTAMVVGLGLSFHSVLEGMAIGAQTDVTQGLGIFIAVVAHKGIAAFALGNKVCVSTDAAGSGSRGPVLQFLCFMILFSLMTPIGISVAWYIVGDIDPDSSPWTGIFGGLGAGTFLYVATVEVIPHELGHGAKSSKQLRLSATLAFIVGTGAMGILAKWT